MSSLPSPSVENRDENAASALRAAFWRYYDFLGRLTLLSALWSSTLLLVAFALVRVWALDSIWEVKAGSALVALAVVSALNAGFGRTAFGSFIEGRFDWGAVRRGMQRHTLRLATLGLVMMALGGAAMNAFVWYLHWARSGTPWGYLPAFLAASVLAALALSSVWILPVLFFRDDPLFKVLWRSVLLVLGHPAESLVLTIGSVSLFWLYWQAPVTGLLLGPPLLLAVPCTMLEKIQWGYTITFQGMNPVQIEERWRREAERGWREFFKPWEGR